MKKLNLLILPLIAIPFLSNCVNEKAEFFEITWNLDNGSEPIKERYKKGDMPCYTGKVPHKDDDDIGSYTFDHTWSPAISKVTQDQTYTANYKVSYNDTYLKINIPEANSEFGFSYEGKLLSVDWGDGETDSESTHTYDSPGRYDIRICGRFKRFKEIDGSKYIEELLFGKNFTDFDLKYFSSCPSLTTISISDKITNISIDPELSLNDSPLLSSIYVDEKNERYTSGGISYNAIINTETGELLLGSNKTRAVPNIVTSIASRAFYHRTALSSISFPNTLNSIGERAFSGCTALSSISFPNTLNSIGSRAFYGCTALTSIDLPDSMDAIENYAFAECNSLKEIKLPQNLTLIDHDVFYNCTSLISIDIPFSVTTIGDCAFQFCESLASVKISGPLTTIGKYAFDGCRDLTSITLPDSVETIGNTAFRNSGLVYFTIPNATNIINEYSFQGCTRLKSVTTHEGITAIGSHAFELCSSLTSFVIPSTVKEIGRQAFRFCSSLKSIELPGGLQAGMDEYVFEGCSNLQSITISEGITTIGGWAFRDTSLTSVNFPTSLKKINQSAFENAKLESVTIPGNVNSIGQEAFRNNLLKTVTIEASKTKENREIAYGAFSGNNELENVFIKGDIKKIANNTFAATSGRQDTLVACFNVSQKGDEWEEGWDNGIDYCLFDYVDYGVYDKYEYIEVKDGVYITKFNGDESDTEIEIPEKINGKNVIGIVHKIFKNNSYITSVNMPDTIETIAAGTFSNCTNLLSVHISTALTRIENSTFEGCEKLKTINFPEGLVSIGGNAFRGNSKTDAFENITFPSTLKEIGSNAFTWQKSLSEVHFLPNAQIQIISDSAFYYCYNLVSFEFPASIETIGYKAFYYTDLEEVCLHKSNDHEIQIGSQAFFQCYTMHYAYLPSNVTKIDYGAFESCNNVIAYCEASEKPEGWNESWLPNDNQRCYWGVKGIGENGDFTYVNTGDDSVDIVSYHGEGESVVMPDEIADRTVTGIGSHVFYGNESTSFTLPSSLTYIGQYAFGYCGNISAFNFPDTLKIIDVSAFRYCSASTYVFPNTLETIGMEAFFNCNKKAKFDMRSFTTADNLPTAERDAFYNDYDGIRILVSSEAIRDKLIEKGNQGEGWPTESKFYTVG